MLLELAQLLAREVRAFNVFNYITLRAVLAALTALVISFLAGPAMIRKLTAYKIGQAVRDDGPQTHLVKKGTPTMGGALILVSLAVTTLLWADLQNRYVWIVLLTTIGFGVVGWVDDWRKVVHRNPKGLSAKAKFLWQSVIGLLAAAYLAWLAQSTPALNQLIVPFFKFISYPLGTIGFILLTFFVIVGTSNAVNLTDGLDGLAIMPTVLVGSALGIFAYVAGHAGYFGAFGLEPFVEGEETHPHVIAVIKEADEQRTPNFGGNWHTDWSFQERPPSFTFLHARELPPYGGDTMFANQYLAWESLSDGLRRLLEGMRAVHSARRPYGPQGIYADRSRARSMKITAGEAALAEVTHPVARVHAETGRTALYVNRVYTILFEGMTERESAPLLDYLYAQAVRPEFTCRIRWQPHALTMWDNRAVQHLAVNDYDGFRRELHRTTTAGERPLSVAEARQGRAAA